MTVRRVLIVGLVVATGFVAAGTGVDASTGPGTPASAERGLSAKNTKPLTKAQFMAQANALCATAAVAASSALQQFASIKNSSPSSQEIAAFIAAYAPIVQNQIKQTQALKPPKRDQSKITKMLQETQTALNAIKANPQLLGKSTNPFLAADTLARAYGLEGAAGSRPCTKGGGGQGGGASTPAST
jgi:hypothetical protein